MTKKQRTSCAKTVSLRRHRQSCTICAHPDREEIERDFIEWKSPVKIAIEYELADRGTIYRHARAFGLFANRDRNIRAALAKIIEKAGEVEVNGTTVVAAVQAYAKVNTQGQWVERSEHLNLNDLFERMSQEELEKYARDGQLPNWFTQVVPATENDSQETVSD